MYLYGDAFSSLRPKERIWDASLADKITGLASDMSFEKVTNYANSFLHRSGENALCKKTIEEFVERTGRDRLGLCPAHGLHSLRLCHRNGDWHSRCRLKD